MTDCFHVPLFRAYLKRLPSGVFRVTVLSTLLPRPLFRMYPEELGEVAAVERSLRHALVVLKCVRPVHGVDHLVMSPHADNYGDAESDSQCAEDDCKVESVFQHGSPHVVHQRNQHAVVSSAEQDGADGYAVRDGHLAIQVVEDINNDSLHPHTTSNADNPTGIKIAVHANESANTPAGYQPAGLPTTQHLRLRVVWQGLL